MVVQGEFPEFPNFPIGKMTTKAITLKSALGSFKQEFQTSEGKQLVVNEPDAEAMDSDDVGQEKVTRYKQPQPTKAQG